MRRQIVAIVLVLAAVGCAAADGPAGRWQGIVQVPGWPLHATLDLQQQAGGAWSGSIIIPELDVAGLPLADISVDAARIAFSLQGALAEPRTVPARLEARLEPGGDMSGTFTQGGHQAPFTLRRSGPAQVDLPARSTPVGPALAGKWIGDYELMGYPRHVTVTFAANGNEPGSAQFVIVGKRTNNLPVDLVTQHENFVRIESHEFGINFEGNLQADAGEIRGTYEQGPIELPLVLRRAGVKP